jgi:hypothetical protein
MSTRISGTARITGSTTAAISQGSRVRSYQSGRICAHGDCDTILSVYNPSKYCTVHAGLAPGGRTRAMPRAITEVACEHCGSLFLTANPARKFCSDRCRMAAFARRKRAAVRAERRLRQTAALQVVASAPDERGAGVSAA